MMARSIYILSLVFLGCIFSSPLTVYAADHRNLEENHPTRIEDAYPIAYRSLELQTRGGYDRNGKFGKDVGFAEFELKSGDDLAEDSGEFGEEYPGYSWRISVTDVESEVLEETANDLKRIDVSVSYNDEDAYLLRTYRFFRK